MCCGNTRNCQQKQNTEMENVIVFVSKSKEEFGKSFVNIKDEINKEIKKWIWLSRFLGTVNFINTDKSVKYTSNIITYYYTCNTSILQNLFSTGLDE